MKINWFTVIAQLINFIVLVWLLKKFLYKPILKAIDEREKKIASQIKEAADSKAEAKKEQEDFIKKNADFDQQKKAAMDTALAEVAQQRQQLLDEAKNTASTLSTKLKAAAEEKQKTEQAENTKKIQKEVFAITKKALSDIASASLQEESVKIFIKKLKGSNEAEKQKLKEAFVADQNTISIKSSFDIPPDQQQEISNTLSTVLGATPTLEYKTTADIISGIELSTKGYKLAWSFAEYLEGLEKSLSETEMKTNPDKNTTPQKKEEPVIN